ncbi:hypothetical protein EON80_07010 [bacterium]|nr:MAG: hypothetical protein EON80_07010 [bacterium]
MPDKIPIWLAVLGAVAVVGAGGGIYFIRPINPAHEYGIAIPSPPIPNAFDRYRAAFKGFRLEPVAQVLDYEADQEKKEDPRKYPLSGKQAWLERQRVGLSLFEEGLKLPSAYPAIRSIPEETEAPSHEELRELAKCIEVRNQVWSQTGQHEEAAQGALDIWQMGLQIANGAPLIPATNGQAIEIYARRSLNGEIAYLTGPQAAKAARRLEKLLNSRVTYREVLLEERNTMPFLIPRIHDKGIYDRKQEAKNAEAAARGESTFFYDTSPPPRNTGLTDNLAVRLITRKYLGSMDKAITESETPWPSRTIPVGSSGEIIPINEKLVNMVAKGRFLFERSDALSRIFLARLALHAYRKDKNRYPASLQELVPPYLSKVPEDPFSNKQPLLYRLDGKRYKLWSVGPDSRDDAATPAQRVNPRSPSAKYVFGPDSTGDVVANISR